MADILGHRIIDVDEDEEITFDWTDKLEEDVLTESTWTIEPEDSPAPVLDDDTRTNTLTSVTISGLAFGFVYRLTNNVVTDAERYLTRSVTLRGTRA